MKNVVLAPDMKEKQYVVFDFDGTVADTLDLSLNIYNRIAHEYDTRQVSQEDKDALRTIKPQELLKNYGISHLKLVSILLRIRKELTRQISETELAKGMDNSLKEIKNGGFSLGILTSNSRMNVLRFLEHHSLTGIMDFIYSGNSIFGKDKVIGRMLHREKIEQNQIVYVGDETRDIEACKKSGIPIIAVTWGLNSKEVLASLHPDYLADDPGEILPFVQQIFRDHPAVFVR